MVGAVKVKCLRVRSEGWSPHKTICNAARTVRGRFAKPKPDESPKRFDSFALRHPLSSSSFKGAAFLSFWGTLVASAAGVLHIYVGIASA